MRGRGVSRQKSRVGEQFLPDDPESLGDFESLLAYLKQSRAFDFGAYKRSTLMRRVLVRMQTIQIKGFAAYLDYLQVVPEEFTSLFNTILINVTSFFRDASTWEYLRDEVLPEVVGRAGGTETIRVWSAGCASGEETYSVAMLLAEALGIEAYRERVKIYATDVDEEALNQARHAAYGARTAEDVPAPLLERYFDRLDDRFVFNKDVRRSVIFGRHDLIQDAPISRVDLLICRNCLMYFNSEAQARILARFHFALAPRGVLFLGKAETILAQRSTFEPMDVKRRVFVKSERQMERRHVNFTMLKEDDSTRQLRDAASDAGSVAQLLVDRDGLVVGTNQALRTLFGLLPRDLGRPLQDLELSYRPFELRSCIERAYAERRPIVAVDGRWTGPGGQLVFLDLVVAPLLDPAGVPLGVSVSFADVSRAQRLHQDVYRASQELETALESILASLRSGVAVVDRELQVRQWSRRAEDLWGLRSDEALHKNTLNLDIGLPVEQLRTPIRACLADESEGVEVTLEATNRRGRPVQVRVSCTPLGATHPHEVRGVILLMEELDGRG